MPERKFSLRVKKAGESQEEYIHRKWGEDTTLTPEIMRKAFEALKDMGE